MEKAFAIFALDILEFIQGIDKEINDMKLAILNETRVAATFFTSALGNNPV